ncbi:pseudouridine synthase [Pseudovirgaria hyperparasitica]|uniref:Pseudouridine synthase n=1 Tax=Pseudovirgaria hyperparasitica TaxID=470096 RepID=A0A6A6VUP8_9PEZI|nr:pseudouridine synthase [Pseudovirgaria hyperparasitica]KAF2753340.1 pseudouridine synthase [Pseudovirgaria hyperparasitica]
MTETSPQNSTPNVDNDYQSWSHTQLVDRVVELEQKLKAQAEAYNPRRARDSKKPSKIERQYKKIKSKPNTFDPSRYNTRLIALKFAYLGQRYNGYEHHTGNDTPLPTIEEVLWQALIKTKLICPQKRDGASTPQSTPGRYEVDVNWDGCEYSKCGRTDKGVSAFGQVIGIRVRSNRPMEKDKGVNTGITESSSQTNLQQQDLQTNDNVEPEIPFDPVGDEIPYVQMLNRVLPPDVRILAWCPNPPLNFSARFHCRERRYKYFFTQPAYNPIPGGTADSSRPMHGHLSISAMREAAHHLVGCHDFRNLCKIDASKQITNWKRRIFHADIEEIGSLPDPSYVQGPSAHADTPKLYAIVVHGSAFLWHQIRHIASILFLIGQGIETPDLVPQLLDITVNPRKPSYEMAPDAPLVLWDCIFPAPLESEQESGNREHSEQAHEDSLEWIHMNNQSAVNATDSRGKWGSGGIVEDLWKVWRRSKMDEILAAQLLDKGATVVANAPYDTATGGNDTQRRRTTLIFDGGDFAKKIGTYTPVMDKVRQESVEVQNAKYRERRILTGKRIYGKPAEDTAEE